MPRLSLVTSPSRTSTAARTLPWTPTPTALRLNAILQGLYDDDTCSATTVRRILYQVLRLYIFLAGDASLSHPESICLDALSLDMTLSTSGFEAWATDGDFAVRAADTQDALRAIGCWSLCPLVSDALGVLPRQMRLAVARGDADALSGYNPSEARASQFHAVDVAYDARCDLLGAERVAGMIVKFARQHRAGLRVTT